MKRILTALLCLVLVSVCVLSLTACKKEVTFEEFNTKATEAKEDFFASKSTIILAGTLTQTYNDVEKKGSFEIKYYSEKDYAELGAGWDYDAAEVDSAIADIFTFYVPQFVWNMTEMEGYTYKVSASGFEISSEDVVRKYDKQGRLTYYNYKDRTVCKISY